MGTIPSISNLAKLDKNYLMIAAFNQNKFQTLLQSLLENK